MKAKLILIGEKIEKTKYYPKPKNVIFQLHEYPIYHLGTIFTIQSMQSENCLAVRQKAILLLKIHFYHFLQ